MFACTDPFCLSAENLGALFFPIAGIKTHRIFIHRDSHINSILQVYSTKCKELSARNAGYYQKNAATYLSINSSIFCKNQFILSYAYVRRIRRVNAIAIFQYWLIRHI